MLSRYSRIARVRHFSVQRLSNSQSTDSQANGSANMNSMTPLASQKLSLHRTSHIAPPRKLKAFLDKYIIGQETGKKVLSVAVYNHYLRIADKERKMELLRQQEVLNNAGPGSNFSSAASFDADGIDSHNTQTLSDVPLNSEAAAGLKNLRLQIEQSLKDENKDLELSKSNILVVGPSGSGKTLLATTMARMLDVPIAITDCTQLTQAGYIGEDVEVCIERLLVSANYDVKRAERGIIVLDEIDKLAKPAASIGTKDVSGEGVQQSLLKIIEGHKVELRLNRPTKHTQDSKNNLMISKKEEIFVVNTSNILFMLMGAFVGLDKHIVKRLKSNNSPIVDNSTERKENHNGATNVDKNAEIRQLRFSNTIEEVELEHGEKISALNLTTPSDLVNFGLIPELIGRVPIVTALQPLQREDLFSILKEPKNALLDQYRYIFKQFGVELCITENALMKVAQYALREGTGARGLRGIMERLLLNVNFELPGSDKPFVLVNEDTVKSLEDAEYSLATNVQARYYSRDQLSNLLEDISKEDPKLANALAREHHIA